jgi:hypothetical protein
VILSICVLFFVNIHFAESQCKCYSNNGLGRYCGGKKRFSCYPFWKIQIILPKKSSVHLYPLILNKSAWQVRLIGQPLAWPISYFGPFLSNFEAFYHPFGLFQTYYRPFLSILSVKLALKWSKKALKCSTWKVEILLK